MDFEQFKQSKRWSDRISTDTGFAYANGGEGAGYIYADALVIEQVTDEWPEATRKRGAWYLIIANDEYITDDLELLERRLYTYACAEGLCDRAPDAS